MPTAALACGSRHGSRGLAPASLPQEMCDDHLVQGLVVAICNQPRRCWFIEGADLLHQSEKRVAAVFQVRHPTPDLRRTERVDIKADVFTFPAITVPFQRPNLIKRNPKIIASKRFVLVELQTVLIVKMQ